MEKKLSKPNFLFKQTLANLKKWGTRLPQTHLEPTTRDSVTFIGHSTMMYDLDGVKIITDPLLYNQIKHIRKNTPIVRESIPRQFDLILLTHFHMDHFHYPSLRLLDKTAQVIAPHGAKRRLNRLGFSKVIEVGVAETIEFAGLKISTALCNHDGRRFYSGKWRDTLSYIIKSSQYTIFSCGDTALTDSFDGIACDVAFMPVGCYTPAELQDKHCSPEQSFKMFQAMHGKIFVPIHFGTLQLALDNELLTLKRIFDLKNTDDRIRLLEIGKNYSWKQLINSSKISSQNKHKK